MGEKADFLKLSDLVELFRQTRYSDGSPVIWYLPFPTQTDGIVLWELPAKENMGKTEWWSALVAWEIAGSMRTGKKNEDMLMVRLEKKNQLLRLNGISERDARFTDPQRNRMRGVLGKKVSNFWDFHDGEGLTEVYKDLCRSLGDGELFLLMEAEHLRDTLFYSAWHKMSPLVQASVRAAAELSGGARLQAEEYVKRFLGDQEDESSLWTRIKERLEHDGQEEFLKIMNSAGDEQQRLEVLAALVLLALNAGEIIEAPELYRQYEDTVLKALARRMSAEREPEAARDRESAAEAEEPQQPETWGEPNVFEKTPEELLARLRERKEQLAEEAKQKKIREQLADFVGGASDDTPDVRKAKELEHLEMLAKCIRVTYRRREKRKEPAERENAPAATEQEILGRGR